MPFLDQKLTPVSSVKDFGITLESHLNFKDHVNTLTSSPLFMLCQINRMRHLLTKPLLSIILNSVIFSKFFYRSTVWAGTSKKNLQNSQLVQNVAASVLTGTKKVDHISPVLRELGWPSIKDQLFVRDTTQVYKIFNSLAPLYLISKLSTRSDVHNYNTRKRDNLNLSLYRTGTAKRSFHYRALSAWNSLTAGTRNSLSLCTFKRSVKRELRDSDPIR